MQLLDVHDKERGEEKATGNMLEILRQRATEIGCRAVSILTFTHLLCLLVLNRAAHLQHYRIIPVFMLSKHLSFNHIFSHVIA